MSTADNLLARLIEDDELYCAKNLKIRDKKGDILPFVWNDAQRLLHQKIEEQLAKVGWVRVIVLKGRQQGVSTYVAARFYKRTSMRFGKRTMIITHVDAATQNLFGMAKTYYELSDDTLRPATKNNNGTELNFARLRSGYKVATAGSKHAGRSDTIQYLHGSEVAFWPNAINIMAGLGQTVPLMPGSEAILESTANGLANLFHSMWTLAVAGKSEYLAVFIPWFIQSEYRREVPEEFELSADEAEYQETFGLSDEQMAWRQAKTNTDFAGDFAWFDQEYPATPDMAFQRVGHKALVNTLAVARARKVEPAHIQAIGAHVVGVDPARFGDDSTAIIHRQGRKAWGLQKIDQFDTMAVVGIIVRMLEDDKTIRRVFVDIGGLGAGIYDRLVELGYGDRVTAVNFGSKATDERKYFNKRSEMWGEMAEWIADMITPSIPDCDKLHADLTAPGYRYSSNGQIKLDSKEEIKKELKKSPDAGDALALTFALPIASSDIEVPEWKRRLIAGRGRKSAMSA
ncbi:hypothetical protein P9K38_09980 [Pseudomonas sp. 905_Psudmo1]|nr:hypothetical protein [Pseudomonas sp. 905_Psudmo1]WFS20638.1 hypothetical protein P9K38_09980 [Pseudomonas sp. 905_Psudmo1]